MRTAILALAALAALAAADPALALNPQPLPPGMRAPILGNSAGGAGSFALRWNHGALRLPRCYGVQRGDPRKQPPMRVCK